MFEDKTPESIHAAIMSVISDEVDKREGSVAHDLTYPAAIEIGNLYMALDTVVELAFADTAYGEYLDLWTIPFGIQRKPAVSSEGQVTLSGPEGTVVPEGTQLQTESDVFFTTAEEVTITSGSATVNAYAETGGVSGNVSANTVNALAPGDLYGVVSILSSTAFTGGVDMESDDSLRARLIERAQKPSTSGNVHHYKQWALEVLGVGDAAVYPLHAGPGSVKVVIVNADKQPPSASVIADANAYIQENKPIGATVTVEGATGLAINIAVNVTLEDDYNLETIKPLFEQALREYLQKLSFTSEPVRYVRIGEVLLSLEGVKDYENLRVNNGTANITPTTNQVAVLGTVTLT